MEVLFKPNKTWWQFWKQDRFLKEGKDYEVKNGMLTTKKKLKGQLEVSYSYNE